MIAAAMLIALHPAAQAAEGVYSNYIPGFYGDIALATEPPSESSIRNDVYYYSTNADRSVRSGRLALGVDITTLYDFFTLLHKPGITFLGAQYAYGGSVAVGDVDLDTIISVAGMSTQFSESRTALGDLTFAPIVLFWNRGQFHYMFSQYIVVPVGDYDNNDLASTGLNY